MNNEMKDTKNARLILYAFFRSLFDAPPTAEKLDYWLVILDALTSGTGFMPLDQALSSLKSVLSERNLVHVQNEYYELFENPFSKNRLQPFASYYIDGKIMGASLVKLRQLLYNLNLGKEEGFRETEDHLVFLIDVMMHLIDREGKENVNVEAQAELLKGYLLPTVRGMARRLEGLEGFPVFRAALGFAKAFLELEECLFPSHHPS